MRFRLRDTFNVAFFFGAVLDAPWARLLIAFFLIAVFKRAPAGFLFIDSTGSVSRIVLALNTNVYMNKPLHFGRHCDRVNLVSSFSNLEERDPRRVSEIHRSNDIIDLNTNCATVLRSMEWPTGSSTSRCGNLYCTRECRPSQLQLQSNTKATIHRASADKCAKWRYAIEKQPLLN